MSSNETWVQRLDKEARAAAVRKILMGIVAASGPIKKAKEDYGSIPFGALLRFVVPKVRKICIATYNAPDKIVDSDGVTHASFNAWATACIEKYKDPNRKNDTCNVWDQDFHFEKDGQWLPLSSIRRSHEEVMPPHCGCDAPFVSIKGVVHIRYADRFSIGGKGSNDMLIGHDNKLVGSNDSSMENLAPRTTVVITSRKFIHISRIKGPASEEESRVWYDQGGKMWKHNYRVEPLTNVVKINLTKKNISVCCCHRGIVQKLLKEIKGE